jgi:N utilization substance protein B
MASRHKGREYALQMLYQAEAAAQAMSDVMPQFWTQTEAPEEARDYAERLAAGTHAALAEIDLLLSESLENWRLERLGIVERNILRLAVFEFLHESETPPIVVIDEAIELAKRFGGEESGQFVNGILDAMRKKIEARRGSETPERGSLTHPGTP